MKPTRTVLTKLTPKLASESQQETRSQSAGAPNSYARLRNAARFSTKALTLSCIKDVTMAIARFIVKFVKFPSPNLAL